jgi:hypothetical protein
VSPLATDAGAVSCSSLSDCQPDGSITYYTACLSGACSVDQCLTDSDCGPGMICACPDQLGGGNIAHLGNVCLMTQCQVDSDCGPDQACSPSTADRCGALQGFFCHSNADECLTNVDCCGSTPICGYQPTLGHWACQAASVCNG